MDRRWRGLLIGLVAVVVLAVGVVVAAPPLTGTPVTQPPPGPPAIGSCSTEQIYPGHTFGAGGTVQYTSLADAPCSGSWRAEVMAVSDSAEPLPTCRPKTNACIETAFGPVSLLDPNQKHCNDIARGYVGLPASGQLVRGWSVTAAVLGTLAGPNPRQRAAGQKWAACTIQDSANTSQPIAPFTRSVRNAFDAYPVPADFAACGAPDPLPISCALPHAVEILGTTNTAMLPTYLLPSCAALLTDRTKLANPAAVGIQAEVVPSDPSEESVDRSCIAVVTTANRLLVGSLINVGAHPLPWQGS